VNPCSFQGCTQFVLEVRVTCVNYIAGVYQTVGIGMCDPLNCGRYMNSSTLKHQLVSPMS
jgi:hypothetical protein